ncbi:MAG TPA: glycosyltransferase [Tepidisphaeraceae bacterium]|nr:glycosyltransferase [Tepidisphaeraceae bacterium]
MTSRMHVLYVHQNYPAQFGPIARHLVKLGWRCTFVSRAEGGNDDGIERISFKPGGKAGKETHHGARGFENAVWQCDGVYRALRRRPDVKPDLVVGHSGFGSTLFLPELYPGVPLVNYFEYYFHPDATSLDWHFRADLRELGWVVSERKALRSRTRNAMTLLDLQQCDAGYAPTDFQRSVFPAEYRHKLRTIFDGVDRSVYHGYDEKLRSGAGHRRTLRINNVEIPPEKRVVTYVSRGFESMRGFDVFVRAARRIYEQYPDVVFIVVGTDRVEYGHDRTFLGGKRSFRQWVLSREADLDLSKFLFVGRLGPATLGRLLAAADLHVYLTVPFILSWSLMDAMSCGAVVLGSATPPVVEMIRDGENGLLADFFDAEGLARKAVAVLRDPAEYRPLGRAAEEKVRLMYSTEAVIPQMLKMYESVVNRSVIAAPTSATELPLPVAAGA